MVMLYHAIGNTANQSKGKLLNTWQYYTQLSISNVALIVLATVIIFYDMV